MVIVIAVGFVVAIVVLAVAAMAVLRESARMDREPPTRWFDAAEALDWVVEHISEAAAATLTLDDVRLIIDLQLDYFRRRGVSRNGANAAPKGDVVVGGSETVDFILRESESRGASFTTEEVHAVVETQLAYLRSIGVVGPRADDPGRRDEP